jgi:ferritin-like metal-binding protein YciE
VVTGEKLPSLLSHSGDEKMKLMMLDDLFVEEMQDLYSAENQLVQALPKIAKAASSPELRRAFEDHLEQTKGHVRRIEEIFSEVEGSPKGKKCVGMEGLLKEGKEFLDDEIQDEVRDAALISAAQRVEHYEIAGYGSARAHAEELGYSEAVMLLQQTLDEEKDADRKLTQIAETRVNEYAK